MVRAGDGAADGGTGTLHAGAVELWPAGPEGVEHGARPEHYRLALSRVADGWRLVAERFAPEHGPGHEPDRWTIDAECLGEFRAEVWRLWGEPVWLALLRACSTTVQDLAPKVMEPKLDLLLPTRMPALAWGAPA